MGIYSPQEWYMYIINDAYMNGFNITNFSILKNEIEGFLFETEPFDDV